MAEMDESLTLSKDIKRACELLEKLQKSKYCGEVPATKLAALQKVLQSEFLNAVREVYEHIYETVDVEGKYIEDQVLCNSFFSKVLQILELQQPQKQLLQHLLHQKATPIPE